MWFRVLYCICASSNSNLNFKRKTTCMLGKKDSRLKTELAWKTGLQSADPLAVFVEQILQSRSCKLEYLRFHPSSKRYHQRKKKNVFWFIEFAITCTGSAKCKNFKQFWAFFQQGFHFSFRLQWFDTCYTFYVFHNSTLFIIFSKWLFEGQSMTRDLLLRK